MVELKGIGAELVFIKGTLEKLEIDPQVIRHGKYKSAIEPLVNEKMSEANREQVETFINSMWNSMASEMSSSRNLSTEQLNTIADNLDALNAEKAKNLKVVDDLFYRDQIYDRLKEKLGLEEDEKLKFVSMSDYNSAPGEKKKLARDKIAVIYAIGAIESGKGDDMTIGSERISKAIRKARKDDKVKAIVMRVNSPGGSALASEVIRREVELAAAEKPFIVSMGDVAASGGYWISCSADKIIADPTTLTGSIGVLGVIPNFEKFFNNKLGVTFDYALTNRNADFPVVTKPLPADQ
jgi:protease-4